MKANIFHKGSAAFKATIDLNNNNNNNNEEEEEEAKTVYRQSNMFSPTIRGQFNQNFTRVRH
jgi:hypothetical protein